MKATYVSVWDDSDEVRTSCEYDPKTNTVSNIETANAPRKANTCTREYIELTDGTEIERANFRIPALEN